MSPHDDALRDDVAVYALGALPAAEATAIRAHLATCGACRREYDALREAAALVGYAAEKPLDELAAARLKARVMRGVFGDAAVGSNGKPAHAAAAPKRARLPYWLAVGTAAAAVVAAFVAVDQNAVLRAHVRDESRKIAYLTAPEAQRFGVPGGAIVRSGKHVLLVMREMPPAPAGKTYQAWTLATGARAVAPSATFAPDPSGVTVVELPVDADDVVAIAVSVEPQGGSTAPTSKPAFVRKLS